MSNEETDRREKEREQHRLKKEVAAEELIAFHVKEVDGSNNVSTSAFVRL